MLSASVMFKFSVVWFVKKSVWLQGTPECPICAVCLSSQEVKLIGSGVPCGVALERVSSKGRFGRVSSAPPRGATRECGAEHCAHVSNMKTSLVGLALLAHSAHAALELTPDNYDKAVQGKNAFIKFLAPW